MEFSQSNDRESSRNIKLDATTGCDNDDKDLEVVGNPSKSQTNDQSDIIDLDDANNAVDLKRIIAAAQKTMKCPLSMQNIMNPYHSTVCGHTYERERILQYLRYHNSTSMGEESVICPQRGCSKTLKLSDLIDVSVLDKVADDGDNDVELNNDANSTKWQCRHCFFIIEQDANTKCKICGVPRDDIGDSGTRRRLRSFPFDSEHEEPPSKRQRLDEKES